MILPKSPTFLAIFVRVWKSFFFLVKSFLGKFYRHLATFYWSHCLLQPTRNILGTVSQKIIDSVSDIIYSAHKLTFYRLVIE